MRVCLAAWPHLFGIMPDLGIAPAELEKLTRRHAVKLNPLVHCLVEEAALAVENVVGHESVKSALCMNCLICIGCISMCMNVYVYIYCHRRQVMMILKDKESDLNLSFSLNFNGYNYMVFASSEKMLGALGTQRERWSARTASPGTRSGRLVSRTPSFTRLPRECEHDGRCSGGPTL